MVSSTRTPSDTSSPTVLPEAAERASLRALAETIVSDPTFAAGLKQFRDLAVETNSTLALIGRDNNRDKPFVALMDPAPLFFAHAQAGLALPGLLARIAKLEDTLKFFADEADRNDRGLSNISPLDFQYARDVLQARSSDEGNADGQTKGDGSELKQQSALNRAAKPGAA